MVGHCLFVMWMEDRSCIIVAWMRLETFAHPFSIDSVLFSVTGQVE